MSRQIALVNSPLAVLVDDCDWEWLRQYEWRVRRDHRVYYAQRRVRRTYVQMHREILSAPTGACVDHVNGDGLDNRRVNLRLASTAQNGANRASTLGRERLKGVSFHRQAGRWQAQLKVDGRTLYLGLFDAADAAARAYDAAAAAAFGDFARLNFPTAGSERAA